MKNLILFIATILLTISTNAQSFYAEYSFSPGEKYYINQQSSIKLAVGHKFNPNLSIFLGAGINWINTNSTYRPPFQPLPYTETYFPVFLSSQFLLLKNKVSPLINLETGYNIPNSNPRPKFDGFYIIPSIGLNFTTKFEMNFSLNAGVIIQKYQNLNLNHNINDFIITFKAEF